MQFLASEAAVQKWPLEKVFSKYAANLQENTHAEVRFQQSCKAIATLVESHVGMGVLL